MKMTSIERAFKKENYKAIAFSFNGAGHPTLTFIIKNNPVSFLLDTGSAGNVLDVEFARKLGLEAVPTGEKGGGVGGLIHDIFSLGSLELVYGDMRFSFDQFFAMDFDTVIQALKSKGVQDDFQGILGFDFFKKNNCFIDYSANRIFVKPA